MTGPATCEVVVCAAPGQVTTSRVSLGDVGPRDVLVRTLASGVSTGTDKWVMQGRFVWVDIAYPSVPGYQLAGVIESVGTEVDAFRVGQRVAAIKARAFGDVESFWGTHASMAVCDVDDIFDAEDVPAPRAALLVSAQVGYNAAARLDLAAGARVLVVGDGIIGSSGALACAARGFDVLVAGRHDTRLEQLRAVGLLALDARTGAAEAIAAFAPDAVIDTAQNDEAFAAYIGALAPRGAQLVYSGHSPDGTTTWADMAVLQKRELTVHFVSGMTRKRLEATLGLMRDGRLPCDRLIGATAEDREATRELMTQVAEGRLRPVAAVIDWSWAR
jgi:2-desacetyl-2-hydroxyethyl bacteriochlorophyllide A dehydrogenase